MCCYFDDIIKIEDFDFDNVLLYDKSYKNILIYDVFCKTLIGKKPLSIMFNKVDGFIRDCDATKWLVYLVLKNITPLMIGLDILYN